MGERGPVPKKAAQRRRTNKPATKAAAKPPPAAPPSAPLADDLMVADPSWHPVVVTWFESLAASGQSAWYQPSDWGQARLLAEAMSRDLNPVTIGVSEETGDPITVSMPVKGASLAAYRAGMATLLVSEGDRRRVQMELERPKPPVPQTADGVDPVLLLDEYRNRRPG